MWHSNFADGMAKWKGLPVSNPQTRKAQSGALNFVGSALRTMFSRWQRVVRQADPIRFPLSRRMKTPHPNPPPGVPGGGDRRIFGLLICTLHLAFATISIATPTQEEVFKSISQNVSESDGSGRMLLAFIVTGAAVLMLLTLFSARRTREATPKALNHSGKLLKEISKNISLRPVELKQLKLLAEGERNAGISVESPLVFLLCPSALTSAMRANRVKVDRKVMAGLARKLGLVVSKK